MALPYVSRFSEWKPAFYTAHNQIRPPIGAVVALRRRPVRVIDIEEIPVAKWHDDARQECIKQFEAWEKPPPPEAWDWRPYWLTVEHLSPPPKGREQEQGRMCYTVSPFRNRRNQWHVLPDNYAVCSTCGDLSPCKDLEAESVAQDQMRWVAKKMDIMPGCCWACKEPISKRQKSITFPGENLELPGGPEVVFHLRSSCRSTAERYEEKWVKADPSRPLRLRCPGALIRHYDGVECSAEVCTGPGASHRSYTNHYHWYGADMLDRLLQEGGFPALDEHFGPIMEGESPDLGRVLGGGDDLRCMGWRCVRCRTAYLRGEPMAKYR